MILFQVYSNMKNILIGIISLCFLSSCNILNTQEEGGTVQTSNGFELDAYDVTLLGVAGVLAKYPDTYDTFVKIANILSMITADGVITSDDIKLQIDTVINESSLSSSKKIAAMGAYRLVLNYFENKYPLSVEANQERVDTVNAITTATQYALELYSLTNGDAIQQVK